MSAEAENRTFYPHHQEGIENLIRTYKNDDRFQALIIGGSVAKGLARPDSDVDFMMVATDAEFESRQNNRDFFINRTDLTHYPNGFVDGKIISLDYLHHVAENGNEPTRAAFDGAVIAFSKIRYLDGLLKDIGSYPEELRPEKIRKFYAMSFIQHWLMNEADRHDNRYTKVRAASQLALFAGRLILAHNRVFFPYHKWFFEYLKKCPQKPLHFLDGLNRLLAEPNLENATHVFDDLRNFQDWGVTDIEAFTWFFEEVELAWMNGTINLEDW